MQGGPSVRRLILSEIRTTTKTRECSHCGQRISFGFQVFRDWYEAFHPRQGYSIEVEFRHYDPDCPEDRYHR